MVGNMRPSGGHGGWLAPPGGGVRYRQSGPNDRPMQVLGYVVVLDGTVVVVAGAVVVVDRAFEVVVWVDLDVEPPVAVVVEEVRVA